MLPTRTLILVSGWLKLGSTICIFLPMLATTTHAHVMPENLKVGRAGVTMFFTPLNHPYLTVSRGARLRVGQPIQRYLPEPPPPPAPETPRPLESQVIAPVEKPPVTPPPVVADPPPLFDETPDPVDNRRAPVAILPDDTRREIREEDVLPFFQIPRGRNVLSPGSVREPPPLPESRATYRQQ